ncbi:MAG TPA: hypothetical protein VNN22_20880 [Verrucomicrobiae bacterium]|nr:hypothetical protein [Verrucomicrobiae bacterium]
MEPKWAEENLQTIRTLMERSALYRRALAPVMLICGISGLAGGVAGWQWQLNSYLEFGFVWVATAIFALGCSTLFVRQQALKDSEPFWSPPTRRVTQALTPPFLIGAVMSGMMIFWGNDDLAKQLAILIWCLTFGCGIHAAGFFMPRGIRWFGWIFILAGFGLLAGLVAKNDLASLPCSPHLLMAAIFGGLHLAYGIYLYFTEKKTPVA